MASREKELSRRGRKEADARLNRTADSRAFGEGTRRRRSGLSSREVSDTVSFELLEPRDWTGNPSTQNLSQILFACLQLN